MDLNQESFLQNKSIILLSIFFIYSFFLVLKEVSSLNNSCNIIGKNPILKYYQYFQKNIWMKIIPTLIILCMYGIIVYFSFKPFESSSYQTYFIILSILIIYFSQIYWNILLTNILKEFGNSTMNQILSIFFSVILFIVLFIYFIMDVYIYKEKGIFMNTEFMIVLILLIIFSYPKFVNAMNSKKELLKDLKRNQFNFLTKNCFREMTMNEKFNTNNIDSSSLLQYNQLIQEKGSSYLILEGNIPVQFLNPKSKNYQDLILSDFYFPGSHYTYLEDTPILGHPSLESIQIALTDFRIRIIHLDIFRSKEDPNKPCVRCKNMANDAKELNFSSCLSTIKKYGWNEDQKYPIFLYMNFEEEGTVPFYNEIYYTIKSIFSKNLMNKKYSFGGRNSSFPISKAPIKDCIEKIIILTNKYPTRSVFDEFISSGNVNQPNLNINLNLDLYKESYNQFNLIGISQDKDKTQLLERHRRNMTFYYTQPNYDLNKPNENKSGLYNPNFQDLAQYGIQGTMMYLFVPDNFLNNWYMFFKSKNNLYPVIKDESLRSLDPEKKEVEEQNPLLGLQNSQKYCLVPGFSETEKSNITVGSKNNSCNIESPPPPTLPSTEVLEENDDDE
jgi:hypothetical protein